MPIDGFDTLFIHSEMQGKKSHKLATLFESKCWEQRACMNVFKIVLKFISTFNLK